MGYISSYDIVNSNSSPYLIAISKGLVPGASPWSKIGYNATGAAAVDVDMTPYATGAIYYPTAQGSATLVSSSTADTATGVGARTVTLYYLDNTFTEKTEVFTLNGTATVNSSGTDMYRFNNLRLTTVGASGFPIGNISIKEPGGTTVIWISSNRTRARQCSWTVPKNKVLYINGINFGVTSGSKTSEIRFTTRATYDNLAAATGTIFIPYHEILLQDNVFHIPLDPPTKFITGVDLKVTSYMSVTGAQKSCALRGWTEAA